MNNLHKLLLRQLKKRELMDWLSSGDSRTTAFLRDISETYWHDENDRKLLERAMELSSQEIVESQRIMEQQRTSLVESSKLSTLGEMAGSIAHEINTPLAVILTLSSQLRELLDDPVMDHELLKQSLQKIEVTTQKIGKIVKGLRSFSRNAAGDPFSRIDTKEVIEDVLSICGERFTLASVPIKIDFEKESIYVWGNAAQLGQVILNLLNNSYDAISHLPEKWLRLSVKEENEWVVILVTDSGFGVPADVREKLFTPFFTTKEVGKGTGIGLSISRKILAAHRGSLELNPDSKNTQFVVKLPQYTGQ